MSGDLKQRLAEAVDCPPSFLNVGIYELLCDCRTALEEQENALKQIMEASGTSTLQWKIANDVLQPKAQ